METFKKILKALLYPHISIVIVLCPIAAILLFAAFAIMPDNYVVNYVSYVISAYALTIVCVRVPRIVKWARSFSDSNKIASKFKNDVGLKIKLSLATTLVYNIVYAAFQLILGVLGGSVLYYSLSAYYFLLAFMKICLFNHIMRYAPGQKMFRELLIYRLCGIGLVLMNLALPAAIAYMTQQSKSNTNDQIITIALAAFTFTSMTMAIINVVKYRKYHSPVFSASKAINLVSALVSLITLEDSMLATFGADNGAEFRMTMVAFTGLGVVLVVLAIAVVMIVRSTKQVKRFENRNPLQ